MTKILSKDNHPAEKIVTDPNYNICDANQDIHQHTATGLHNFDLQSNCVLPHHKFVASDSDDGEIKKFTILGERCSGTNVLQKLIETNFDLEYSNDFHHKHFFGFCNYSKIKSTQNTLFICIVRNVYEWILSLHKMQMRKF